MQNETENSNGFLDELKTQFQNDLDARNALDTKSTHLITMSSTIVTILVSIGTFLVSKIGLNPNIENPLIFQVIFFVSLAILGVGIILATICIYNLTKSYSLRKYKYPMGHEKFFANGNGKYLSDKADQYRNYPNEEFNKHIIREYLESIKFNADTISKKGQSIKEGQKYLNPSIISIAVLLSVVLVTFGFGLIILKF